MFYPSAISPLNVYYVVIPLLIVLRRGTESVDRGRSGSGVQRSCGTPASRDDRVAAQVRSLGEITETAAESERELWP